MKGCKHAIEGGSFDVLFSAHCKTGCGRYNKLHEILAARPSSHHQYCVLVASAEPRAGRTTQPPQESSCVQLLIPPDF